MTRPAFLLPLLLPLVATLGMMAAIALPARPGAAQSPSEERCRSRIAAVHAAIERRESGPVSAAATALRRTPGCDDGEVGAARVAASLALAELGVRPGLTVEQKLETLRQARAAAVTWPAQMALGEVLSGTRAWGEATLAYQEAVNAMNLPSQGEPEPQEKQVALALARASETQMLAPEVAPPITRNGTPGGLASPRLRNLVVRVRMLPVTFFLARAEMTEQGQAVAQMWWDGLRNNPPEPLVLVGHSDPTGDAAINEQLSLRRAQALADFLRARGYQGPVQVQGRGARCPVAFSSPDYTTAEKHQILRRVEVLRADGLAAGDCPK